jgi:autotransporter-associated beta strand protein
VGGVISDGGNGYGLTFAGSKNTTLTNINNYGGATTVFGGGTLVLSYGASVSNSSIVLGQTGSSVAAYLTLGGATLPAGTTVTASNLVVDASVIGGQNYGNLNNGGTSAGNATEQFTGALQLNSGLLRTTMAANASYNLELLFNSFSRNPGTVFSFDRATIPGGGAIGSQTADTLNLVFATPPALIGSGPAGTTTMGVLPGITLGGAGSVATYDTTYGVRPLAAAEYAVFASGLTPASQNARVNGNVTVTASTEVNSLYNNGSYTLNLSGTNTLTLDSGVLENTVNGVIGASANDGFLALGAEGIFDVANARTLTINSVITGSNGLTINLDDYNGTGANCVLAGTNTFTGVTRVLANQTMTLKLNNSLALQNSTLDYNNYGGTITFNGPTSFTFGGLEGAQNLAIAVPLTLGGDGDSTVYSGVLSGAGSLIKTGSGSFTLTGANTYSGGTTLASGQLNLNNGGSSGANSSLGTGALTINGGTLDNTSGASVTLAPNNAQNWNGNFTFNGSASLNLGTGLVALGGSERVTVNANTLTVGGVISGTGDALTKAGAGTLSLSAANSYSGNTVVGAGRLALTGGAGLSSSPGIIVSNGATLDVSGLTPTFTLGGGQSLCGSGTINGSVSTAPGAEIYADSGAAGATNTFNNNLTLVSGAAVNFKLGTTAGGANDLIVVGGNLTLAGNSINLSAPSTSVSLATGDYTLITVGGSIAGAFASTPGWVVRPVNADYYTIVTSGKTVTLHYQAAALPTITGGANPPDVSRGQNTVVTAAVVPGTFAVSSVILNAAPIGGAGSLTLVQSNASSVYTNTVMAGAGAPAGTALLAATVTDAEGNIGTTNITVVVLPGAETWGGGSTTDNNWSDAANWAGGAAPLTGDNVTLAGDTRPAPVMDASFSLGSLTFASGAGSFVITNTPGSVLTLSGGVVNNSAAPESLNVPVVLGAAQTLNAAAGNLALGGVVSGASLTVAGTNLVTLSGTNTYGGGTTVSAGTVVVANDSALGSGVLTLAGGSVSNSAGSSCTVPNNVTVASGAEVEVGSGDVFTLSGMIGGGGALTKTGNGLLVLPNANTLSGGVTVNGGTLVVANNAAVGSGLLTLGNASISNSAGNSFSVGNAVSLTGSANVMVNTNDTLTLSGLITNAGGLNLTGAGTLVIPGGNANTYSGGTVLNAGITLKVGNTSLSPLGAGALTLAGGTLADGGTAPVTLSNNITVVSNTTSYLNPTTLNGNGLTLAGNLSGSGNLVVNGSGSPYDSFVLSGTNSGFTGTLTVNNSANQRFAFGSPGAGSPNAAFVLNSAGTDEQKVTFGNGTIAFGSLAGGGWLRNDGGASLAILRIGDLNSNAVFGGLIAGNGSAQFGVLKAGLGTETFTNDNTYDGTNEVAGGTLELTSAQQTAQPLQVDDGAIFGYQDTGSGQSAQVASLVLGTNAGANLFFTNIFAAGASPVNITDGELTANGTCTVTLADTANLSPGNLYTLVQYTTFSGNGNFVLAPLPGGVAGGLINDPNYGGLILSLPQPPSGPQTNLTATVTSAGGVSTLSLSWPANYQGWVLETNNVGLNASSAWGIVSGSEYTTSESFTVDPTQTNVFFQLVLP